MIKVLSDIQLAKNFKLSEFVCKDGNNEVLLDMELVNKLQKLRDLIGIPITIVSAYRSPSYNKSVGGVDDSQHVLGKAADIQVAGMKPQEVAHYAEQVGFNGIGTYSTFVHVDVRKIKARWNG